jgi:predicted ribosome quality control (RQC) complex YloA/Tae2 family protein
LLPLQHLHPLTALPFDDIHDAVRFFLARSRSSQHADTERRDLTVALERTIERTRRTIAAVEEELAGANRGLEYERCGRLLLTNLDAVKRGERTVSLPDGEEHRTITLDPRLTPAANADRYFEKAKTARTARREATARLEQLRAHEALAARLREQIDGAETTDDLRRLLQERGSDLETVGIRKGGVAAADLPPFRMFTVEGGFQVWAGKSSANNDDLTLHHCRPDDLWFHARGGSGAHVVLKVSTGRGEPGKRAREQAAGIAAYYSKMKTAGMVPVAMTLRKYVRKPRGAPPGTVIIERETVLFAHPALPERQAPH